MASLADNLKQFGGVPVDEPDTATDTSDLEMNIRQFGGVPVEDEFTVPRTPSFFDGSDTPWLERLKEIEKSQTESLLTPPRGMSERQWFEKLKTTTSGKDWAQRVEENMTPPGRGALINVADTVALGTNLLLRGASWYPGLEGLSDYADHRNRVMDFNRRYHEYLDETGTTADIIGPSGAKFTGMVGGAVGGMGAVGLAGKAVGVTKAAGFTKWFASIYAAKQAEQSLTVAEDAGLHGFRKFAYAGGMGALEGLITLGAGRWGESVGIGSAEEIFSRLGPRFASKLMTRSGLTREVAGMAVEGLEEEAVDFTQSLWGEFYDLNTWDEYQKRLGTAGTVGVATRAILGLPNYARYTKLHKKIAETVEKIPDAAAGTIEAQDAVAENRPVNIPADASETYIQSVQEATDLLNRMHTEFVTTPMFEEMGRTATSGPAHVEDTGVQEAPSSFLQPIRDVFASMVKKKKPRVSPSYTPITAKEVTQKDLARFTATKDIQYNAPLDEKVKKVVDLINAERAATAARQVAKAEAEALKKPQVGSSVQWVSNGQEQFTSPRKITAISDDSKWAFVEGSNTGIPMAELEMAEIETAQEGVGRKTTKKVSKPIAPDNVADMNTAQNKLDAEDMNEASASVIASQHKLINDTREFLGLDTLAPEERKRFTQMIENAFIRKIPEKAETIAREYLSDPTGVALDDDTTVGMTIRARTMIKDMQGLAARIKMEINPEVQDALLNEYQEQKHRTDVLTTAMFRGISDAGRRLVSAKLMLATNADAIIEDTEARIGRKLSEEEKTKLKRDLTNWEDPEVALIHAKRRAKRDLETAEELHILEAAAKVSALTKQLTGIDPKVNPKEYDKVDYDLHDSRIALHNAIVAPSQKNMWAITRMLFNTWRAWSTTFDAAAAGLHGSTFGLAAWATLPFIPGKQTVQQRLWVTALWPIAFLKSLRALVYGGEMPAFRYERDIRHGPHGDLINKGAVTILTETTSLVDGENLFANTMLNYAPGRFLLAINKMFGGLPGQGLKVAKNFVNKVAFRPFNRAFKTFVNELRSGMFNYVMAAEGGTPAVSEAKAMQIGHTIDLMTGRGGRGWIDKIEGAAAGVIYAPRYFAAPFELLLGRPFWSNAGGRGAALELYVAGIAAIGSHYLLAALYNTMIAQEEEDKLPIQYDPTSPGFGEITIGSYGYTPAKPILRAMEKIAVTTRLIFSRDWFEQNTGSGIELPGVSLPRIPSLGDSDKEIVAKLERNLGRFARGQQSLPAGFVYDVWRGFHWDGTPVSLRSLAVKYGVPFYPQQATKILTSDYGYGEKAAHGLLQWVLPGRSIFPANSSPSLRLRLSELEELDKAAETYRR